MDAFAQFLDYLIKNLKDKCPTLTDPRNIIIGESQSLLDLGHDEFPRAEILITKLKCDGFIDQRSIEQSFRFSIGGFIRRDDFHVSPDDMYAALHFGREMLKVVMESHEDRIRGNFPCEGFQQINGYPEVFYEYEMFDKITGVILNAEAQVTLPDIYI